MCLTEVQCYRERVYREIQRVSYRETERDTESVRLRGNSTQRVTTEGLRTVPSELQR